MSGTPPADGFLAHALATRPEAPALDHGRGTLSYRALAREADALAGRLGSVVRPGQVVATFLPSGASSVVVVHGVTRAGAAVAPLNPRLTDHELAAALKILRPAAVVTAPAGARRPPSGRARSTGTGRDQALDAGRARSAGAGDQALDADRARSVDPGRAHSVDADRIRSAAAKAGLTLAAERSEAPLTLLAAETYAPLVLEAPGAAAVLWTSGTAGRPRGVVLTGSGLAHVAAASRTRLDLSPDDRWYAALSPAHVGGLALIVRAALLGSAVVVRPEPDLAELSALMEAGDVTHASLVPVLLRRLLELRGRRPAPPALRCLLVGGAAAAPPLVERAVELGYPVALTYGLTEATSQVATASPALVRRKPGTVGPPLDGVEVRTSDDGEILVRGPTLAPGTLDADGYASVASGAWLRTGDLGRWDGEGHLHVTGRRSDRIVTGGVTVDPGEVEAVIVAHPAVREAAVVGIADTEWGERVAAAVVLAPGAPSRLDEVEALCRERLTSAKVPRRLRAVDELPRNPNGKVERDAVRALLE